MAPLFEDIRLLGELPLNNTQRKELGQLIRRLIKQHGLTQATRLLKNRYPRVFLTYLALTAARNEERGFWDVVAKEVGVSQAGAFFNRNHHWGRIFLELLPEFDLVTFADVQSGHEYLTAIRLHGGIPAYSLFDFFEKVLTPIADAPEYADVEPEKLIEFALSRSAVQHFVDSPVRYFLQYGGEAAQDFFAKCLRMARAWEDEGRTLTATELGLPPYVVQAFQAFKEGQLTTRRGKRLRRPILQLEPTDRDYLFSLTLPEEPVDADRVTWQYHWHLILHTADGETEEWEPVEVRLRRKGEGVVTAQEELTDLDPIPGQLRVAFVAQPSDDQPPITLGRWYFDLAPPPGEPPLLAFRPYTGRPIRLGSALPATDVWLMIPAHLQVQAPANGRLVTEAFELWGDWSDWKVEHWDLTGAQVVHLRNPENDAIVHSWPVQAPNVLPHFAEEEGLQDADMDVEETPLFIGSPPRIWLPRLTDRSTHNELASWSIRIQARWPAQPAPAPHKRSLGALANAISQQDEGFILPLTSLLGERAWGVYDIELEGPRHMRKTLSCRIWPQLTIEDLAPYYPPGPAGPEPINFFIQVAPSEQIILPPDVDDVEVETTDTPGRFRIQVAAEATRAELTLVSPQTDAKPVQVPLQLRTPRLRWLIRLEEEELTWMMQPGEWPVDKLLQNRQAYLLLSWENAHSAPPSTLQLLNAETQPGEVLQEEAVQSLALAHRAGLSLIPFFSTLRESGDLSSLLFALELYNGMPAIPLLFLRRDMGVTALLPEWTEQGTLVLYWEATHRLRSRRVALWNAWQPWETPREYKIPDEIGPEFPHDPLGSGAFEIPEPLPRSAYYVVFRTAPEWEITDLPPLPPEESLALPLDLEEARQRLKAIEEQWLDGDISPFLMAFERAAIFHFFGRNELRDREIRQAMTHLLHGKVPQITALYHWVQQVNPDLARKLRVEMYRPRPLKKLLNSRISKDQFHDYMAHFTETRVVSPESARLVLKHTRNPEWRAHATKILLQRIDRGDVTAVVGLVEEGLLSEEDVMDLLADEPETVIRQLDAMPSSSVRDALLEKLIATTQAQNVIKPGIWVHSEAGWGQLEEILLNDEPVPHLILRDNNRWREDLIFKVKLPRKDGVWQVEIRPAERKIDFPGAHTVYQCARSDCRGFASVDLNEIIQTHTSAAHMGISPSFKSSPPTWRYRRRLTFSWDDQNPYA